MTENAAGSSSVTPPTRPYRATSRLLKSWFNATQLSPTNSGTSSARSRRAASLKREAPIAKSALEETFALLVKVDGLPPPVREHRFHPTRKWRFDFSWPDQKVAVELEGGLWTGGRHTRAAGFIADAEKYAEAQLLGWIVLRLAGVHLKDGTAMNWTRRALGITP